MNQIEWLHIREAGTSCWIKISQIAAVFDDSATGECRVELESGEAINFEELCADEIMAMIPMRRVTGSSLSERSLIPPWQNN